MTSRMNAERNERRRRKKKKIVWQPPGHIEMKCEEQNTSKHHQAMATRIKLYHRIVFNEPWKLLQPKWFYDRRVRTTSGHFNSSPSSLFFFLLFLFLWMAFFFCFFYFFSVLSLFDFVNEFYGKTKDEIISGRRPTTKKEEKKKKAKRNGWRRSRIKSELRMKNVLGSIVMLAAVCGVLLAGYVI